MNIENRLAKLEAQNRLLRTVVVGAFALAVLPWLLGSDDAAEDVVRAKQFVLVDDSGNPRGEWSYQTKTGTAELRLQLGQSSPAISLVAGPNETSASLVNGALTIKRGQKTVFVAPPKMSVVPVGE